MPSTTNGIDSEPEEIEIDERFKDDKQFLMQNTIIKRNFNTNELENPDLKKLIGFKDNTVSPKTIDDMFGVNFSKVKDMLIRLLKMSNDKILTLLKVVAKTVSDKKRFESISLVLEKDVREVMYQNLAVKETILGNIDAYLNLREIIVKDQPMTIDKEDVEFYFEAIKNLLEKQAFFRDYTIKNYDRYLGYLEKIAYIKCPMYKLQNQVDGANFKRKLFFWSN